MNSHVKCPSFKMLLLPFCLIVCSIIIYIPANAQEQPPKPIEVALSTSVITAQNLSFGTFIVDNNAVGTITVRPDGGRSATGNVIIPATSSIVSPALFIVTALPGTLITIMGTPTSLTGSAGGSMTLTMLESEPMSPLIVPPANTPGGINTELQIRIGGRLTVGTSGVGGENPPGLYGGPFIVTFIQQ